MTIPLNPPPLEIPEKINNDPELSPFFNYLLKTFYQLWKQVRGSFNETTVRTTNATPTALQGVLVPTDRSIYIRAEVIARRTGGSGAGTNGDSAFYIIEGGVKNISGVLSLAGGSFSLTKNEDDASWDVTLATNGETIVLTATGAADVNITWVSNVRAIEAGV